MSIKVAEEGKASTFYHMERDRLLLAQGSEKINLSFYEWDSFSITYGLFAGPEKILNMDICQKNGIPVIARPTGGGVLFHENDVPFSLFIPAEYTFRFGSFEHAWRRMQDFITDALSKHLGWNNQEEVFEGTFCERFCMAQAHSCDFIWARKKIGGAAFRKSKKGTLCQASFFYEPLSWGKFFSCVKAPEVIERMKQVSEPLPSKISKELIKKIIILAISEFL